MNIEIELLGVPPKKDGANSMWRKPVEIPRIRLLREAVFRALDGTTINSSSISLGLTLRAERRHGDLDNFLTGILDALQAPHARTPLDPSATEWAVAPVGWSAIKNDDLVDRIEAVRELSNGQEPSYTLRLEF